MKEWYFILQWHITDQCDLRCSHCYMYDEPSYTSEIQNPLSTEECFRVMDSFLGMLARLSTEHGIKIMPRINFTGGDPILRPDLFELLDYAEERNIYIGMLGNPNHITPDSAQKLREHGVGRYQISIDGMEDTHDSSRRKGSFSDSLRALEILKEAGIMENVMFSLSKQNAHDLIPVMQLMAEREIRRFDFARVAAYGNARELGNDLQPLEYRELLMEVYEAMKRLGKRGVKTEYGFKDHLWNLLRFELGDYTLWGNNDGKRIYDGCHAGQTFLVLLADGTIYACRRFVSPIGNVRRDDLYHVFRYSQTLNKMRNVELYEKCRLCELRQYCRGCPAVAAGANSGAFLAPDPQCWKKL
jgi:radical SAM/SPASM domain protein of ACGX system